MINIVLSNKNHQGIQKLLEEQQGELQKFIQDQDKTIKYPATRLLVSLMLSEHFNCKGEKI